MPVVTSEEIVPDIVAFSGQRKFDSLAAGHTNEELRAFFRDTLVAAGWEQLSATTLRSQQSPWYDIDNIPAWYIGNKIVVELETVGALYLDVRFGADYGGSTEFLMTGGARFRITMAEVSAYDRIMLASPYQFVTNSSRLPTTSGSSDAFGDIVVSALNVPKAVFQKEKVVHNIFVSNRMRKSTGLAPTGSGGEFVIYRTRDDLGSSSFAQRDWRLVTPVGGQGWGNTIGRRIWNRALDPDMDEPNKWSGFFSPPYVCFTPPGASTFSINGFFWDSFLLTEGFTYGTRIVQTERNWDFYCGYSGSAAQVDAALFFCTTEIGVEE